MNQPIYKSLKVSFRGWQILTRLAAETGEPRTKLLERLIREAAEAKGLHETANEGRQERSPADV